MMWYRLTPGVGATLGGGRYVSHSLWRHHGRCGHSTIKRPWSVSPLITRTQGMGQGVGEGGPAVMVWQGQHITITIPPVYYNIQSGKKHCIWPPLVFSTRSLEDPLFLESTGASEAGTVLAEAHVHRPLWGLKAITCSWLLPESFSSRKILWTCWKRGERGRRSVKPFTQERSKWEDNQIEEFMLLIVGGGRQLDCVSEAGRQAGRRCW